MIALVVARGDGAGKHGDDELCALAALVVERAHVTYDAQPRRILRDGLLQQALAYDDVDPVDRAGQALRLQREAVKSLFSVFV